MLFLMTLNYQKIIFTNNFQDNKTCLLLKKERLPYSSHYFHLYFAKIPKTIFN